MFKNRFPRILHIMIFLALIITFMTSCNSSASKNNNPTDNAGVQTGSENTGQSESTTAITLNLPDVDMNGKVFTFLTSDWPGEAVWHVTDITVEELNGEALNDAKYTRNMNIESKYNCKIAEINVPSSDEATGKLNKSVKAQDGAYDVFLSRMQLYQNLGASGAITDLHNLEYVDFKNPWWDRKSVESLSIAHKLFAVCGDITTMDKAATSAIVFNKQLLSDYALDNPYSLVRNGKWTVDKFMEMSKQISNDLNGDGKMDENDRYGLLYQRDTVLSFFSGGGDMIGKKDADDIPYITLGDESTVSSMTHILESLYDKASCFNVMFLTGDFNVGMNKMFQNDQSLFMWIRMINIVPLRSMPTDFGILPIPKKDEAQNYYSSDVNSWTGVCLTVPATNTDYADTGILFEAYAAESSKTVQPAYYDILLNGIIARDDESLEMLNIIFKNRTYDIGAIGMYGKLNEILYLPMTYDLNVTSYVEKRFPAAERDIQKLIDKISALN